MPAAQDGCLDNIKKSLFEYVVKPCFHSTQALRVCFCKNFVAQKRVARVKNIRRLCEKEKLELNPIYAGSKIA